MGYRFQLVSATFQETAKINGQMSVKLQIRNAGFAPLYNERHAYIVFKNGNKTYSALLQSDPRSWLPNGEITTVDEQITVPALPEGTYQLYLYLPDAYASLAANPAYAVRFANTGVWEASTGMNKLNATVTIAGQADGVDNVQVFDENAPMYDLLGRPVDKSYHGVVLQNGHKYLK